MTTYRQVLAQLRRDQMSGLSAEEVRAVIEALERLVKLDDLLLSKDEQRVVEQLEKKPEEV